MIFPALSLLQLLLLLQSLSSIHATKPTTKPSSKPTTKPSSKPTTNPTTKPSSKPTTKPSSKPTTNPTTRPSSNKPTPKPTGELGLLWESPVGTTYTFDGTTAAAIDLTSELSCVQANGPRAFYFEIQTTANSCKASDAIKKYTVVVSTGSNAANSAFTVWFNCGAQSGIVSTDISTAAWRPTSGKAINDGLWHSVMVTYDGSTMTSYVDSIFDNSDTVWNTGQGVGKTFASTVNTVGNSANFIGKNYNDRYAWIGSLKNVKFYNYVIQLPTAYPTVIPTILPTPLITGTPTNPTTRPTVRPTVKPSLVPTLKPSSGPTLKPSTAGNEPTTDPTLDPTFIPTLVPTTDPTAEPTADPTTIPTAEPSYDPTVVPTLDPTFIPTLVSTTDPTTEPTAEPTTIPTAEPSCDPTVVPTLDPTAVPTYYNVIRYMGAAVELSMEAESYDEIVVISPSTEFTVSDLLTADFTVKGFLIKGIITFLKDHTFSADPANNLVFTSASYGIEVDTTKAESSDNIDNFDITEKHDLSPTELTVLLDGATVKATNYIRFDLYMTAEAHTYKVLLSYMGDTTSEPRAIFPEKVAVGLGIDFTAYNNAFTVDIEIHQIVIKFLTDASTSDKVGKERIWNGLDFYSIYDQFKFLEYTCDTTQTTSSLCSNVDVNVVGDYSLTIDWSAIPDVVQNDQIVIGYAGYLEG